MSQCVMAVVEYSAWLSLVAFTGLDTFADVLGNRLRIHDV